MVQFRLWFVGSCKPFASFKLFSLNGTWPSIRDVMEHQSSKFEKIHIWWVVISDCKMSLECQLCNNCVLVGTRAGRHYMWHALWMFLISISCFKDDPSRTERWSDSEKRPFLWPGPPFGSRVAIRFFQLQFVREKGSSPSPTRIDFGLIAPKHPSESPTDLMPVKTK